MMRAYHFALAMALGSAAHAAQPMPAERNTRHALLIAIGEYTAPDIPTLKGTVHDVVSARRMARAMAVPEANITVLRDRDATVTRIRDEIDALFKRMGDGDRVFVYYSGHGTRWYDASIKVNGCTEGLLATDGQVLTNIELGRRLAPLARRADKMLVFYDACFSGGVAGAPLRTRAIQLDAELITPKFTPVGATETCSKPTNFRTRALDVELEQAQALPVNVVHVAASRPDEVSFDSSVSGGFATSAWRDCLLGEARDLDGSGAVTVDEVTQCAQGKVSKGLAGQAGILGQQMTVGGNAEFVPAWMGATFAVPASPAAAPAAAVSVAPVQAALPSLPSLPSVPPPTQPLSAPPASLPIPVLAPIVAPVVAPAILVLAPAPLSVPAAAGMLTSVASAPSQVLPAVPMRMATPADLLTQVHVQRNGNRQVSVAVRKPVMRIDLDPLEIDVTSANDGYLYIALAGSDGKSLYLLFPNELAADNRVRAGQALSLPGKGWEVVAAGPAGSETLLVMVTDTPRDLSALRAEKAGPFVKSLLDTQGRAQLQRVLGNGTPGANCAQGGAARCSDAFGSALLRIETVDAGRKLSLR